MGCRQRAPAAALQPLCLVEGRVQAALAGRARPSGRGAWLHPSEDCLKAALKSRAFDRAFRAPVAPADPAGLWAALQDRRRSS